MKILGVKAKDLLAMVNQPQAASCPDGSCPFAKMLKDVTGDRTKASSQTSKSASANTTATSSAGSAAAKNSNAAAMEMKLNETIGVAFIAPLLAQTVQNVEQSYFLHSPAEQAYAKQMYLDIASRMSTSGKMPLAKNIVKAVLQQMGNAEWKSSTADATAETSSAPIEVTAY